MTINMLPVNSPLLFTDYSLFNEGRKHLRLTKALDSMFPYTYRIGVDTIMYDIEHPRLGLVTIYQHMFPDKYQPSFTMETRGDYSWLYQFRAMSEIFNKLK